MMEDDIKRFLEKEKRNEKDLHNFNQKVADRNIEMNTALAGEGNWFASVLAEKYNHNFTAYDSAVDAIYNSTHIGGSSLHHLLDGQHDVIGAYRAVRDVHADDTFLEEIKAVAEHLLRDTASVSGINPFYSLEPEQFERIARAAGKYGISRTYTRDMLTVNGPEMIGGVLGLTSAFLLARNNDDKTLSKVSSSFLVSSLISANPFLTTVAAGGLVHSYRSSEDKFVTLKQAGKGSIVSGGSLLAGSLVMGPGYYAMLATFIAAISLNHLVEHPEKSMDRIIQLKKPAASMYRQVNRTIKEGRQNGQFNFGEST